MRIPVTTFSVCRWLLLLFTLFSLPAMALSDLDYLPSDISYDNHIPTPAQVMGAPVGEWHVRHDQLVDYMRVLAEASERVSLLETGRTHENRPLLLLAFSSPKNQAKLESIRQAHLAQVSSGKKAGKDAPLVLWMGYSVHGDEPSGSNAALLIAYYLAAGRGEQIDRLLDDNVVLLDPALNPDGLSRFAQWANMHKGRNLVSDPSHREHVQDWPSGRTNHYWFDLNRDWLLLTHPESQARIKQFHRWRPHVLTDFHEMGANSTYFFQPGIPSRKNPWTPDSNVELTHALGKFHAAALDQRKQLYFTQEGFDDFYYGKGSTYPDAHGSVGILFEQASARGHLQDTINGPLSFVAAIQNQVTTSLSTFAGALANRQALLVHPRQFFQQTRKLIRDEDLKGYVLAKGQDSSRFVRLLSLLDQHQIRYQSLAKDLKLNEQTFRATESIFLPLDQPQYRLIKSLFSTRKRFNDNTFYDVSNWNLPLAFNLAYAPVSRRLDTRPFEQPVASDQTELDKHAYAYVFSWQDSHAPRLLYSLLGKKVQARISPQAFAANTSQGQISFNPGAVVIPAGLKQPNDLIAILTAQSRALGIKVWSIKSGLTNQGADLGSRSMLPAKLPRVLLVGGTGTSQYEAGEVWHYLDQQVGMPVSLIELARLSKVELGKYSHIIWVEGDYADVGKDLTDSLKQWLMAGGVLIGQKSAARWFSQNEWLKASFIKPDEIEEAFNNQGLRYADREALAAKKRIAGAAFATRLDTSHPLAFGYQRSLLPVFRNSTLVMQAQDKPFITVAKYTEQPLLAGYAADEWNGLIGNSAAIVAHKAGQGRIIAFTDNINFRGYWQGTSRLLSNAIFLSGFIDG